MILARKITAIDSDISDKTGVKLELHGKDSDKFQLDPGNGDIYLATDKLDREEKEVYYLRLKATDSEGNIGEGQLVGPECGFEAIAKSFQVKASR